MRKRWIADGDVILPDVAWRAPGYDKAWLMDKFLDDQVQAMDFDSPLQPKSLTDQFGFIVSILSFLITKYPMFSILTLFHFYHSLVILLEFLSFYHSLTCFCEQQWTAPPFLASTGSNN
jgi:hypothetical protein